MKHGSPARLNPILDSEVSQYPYLTMSPNPVPALNIGNPQLMAYLLSIYGSYAA